MSFYVELESQVGAHLERQVSPAHRDRAAGCGNRSPSNTIRALAVRLSFMVRHHRMHVLIPQRPSGLQPMTRLHGLGGTFFPT